MKFAHSASEKLRSICHYLFAAGMVAGLLAALPARSLGQTPVLTQHNDNSRSGAYTTETTLTPTNVNQSSFGKLFTYPVDGYLYAQPLYVPGVAISGKGTHNVIYVATEHDSIYAFDADSNGGSNSTPLWQITLLDAAHGAASGATTVPNSDLSTSDIVPEIGITGTPVIDGTTGTLYVVGKTKEGTVASPTYVQRLHALDITTGAEKFGGPVTISASLSGSGTGSSNGTLAFDPKWQNQRPGLLLQNGVVYLAFGSHGDNGPWHGWIISYNAATLKQVSAFCTTASGSGSGIWMSGAGIAGEIVDPVNKPYGRMFVATGNGSFNATTPYTNAMSYGDDIVNLDLTGGVLTVQDSFTPSNQGALDGADEDVASGGVLLLPNQTAGSYPHLLVQAGKEGKIYLVNRDNMGGYSATTDNVVEEVPGQSGGLWSIPAFWNNTVYTWGQVNNLMAFSLVNGLLSTTPTATGPQSSNYPGATPAVSANGTTNGIVWAVQTDGYNTPTFAILRAYNAANVATELYDSTQNATRDTLGQATKFVVPTVANGKVYVGTAVELDVFGLLNGGQTAATPVISPASETFSGTLPVTITDSTSGASIYYTTDGSTPSTSSTKYTGAISVTTTETITAIASATGYVQSQPAAQTYTLQNQVATPAFSPASTTFTSPISVTLTDSTSGAKIYYTLDGSTPGTSSTLYSAPIAVSGTTTINAIAAATGMINSNVSSAVYTYSNGTGTDFVNGFSNAGATMTFNGSTDLADTRLQLTNGGTYEAGSAWFNTPLNVQSFTNNFTFQIANPGADGFTFTIQNAGLNALGPYGGGLGYGPYTCGATSGGITNSVAIKFDIYDNCGEGSDSTGLYTNGATPTLPAVDMSASGIDLTSGDTFSVQIVYNGTTLTMTITDGVTNATFTTSWTVNIPQIVGANTAYVGFTGGTGGQTSSQKIETWTFSPTTQSSPQTATPAFSLPAGTYLGTQTVSLSDSTSGAAIFYTLDGTVPATSAGGSTMKYSGPITVTATETIRAIATASGYSASVIASAAYTIETQTAAPTFSPAAGTYATGQSVSLSTTTSGASIYYTLDGTTPNTSAGGSTVLYSAPINVIATTTVKAIAAASGYFASNVSSATYTITSAAGSINFGSGFSAGGMVLNGATTLSGTRLRLTDGNTYEASSAWYATPVSVTSFTNNFSFQVTPGTSPTADGFAFVIQANNTTALSQYGGGLGYGSGTYGVVAPNAILNSVAIKFDLYNNAGEGNDSTGIYTNGASPTTPFVDMTNTGINLHSGDIFNVAMTYNGTSLVMTITDTVTAAAFTQSWPINIASTIGSSTAYFGFTGGTGGLTAIQDVLTWTVNTGSSQGAAATPTFSPAAGTYASAQNVTLSDTTSGATIYYTTNGSIPSTSSTKYTAAIPVSSSMTINAIAVATGYNNSAVASAAYTIQTAAATPTFSPAAGTYTSAQNVTLSDTTSGATIYYTTNGSTPTTSSTKYTAAIPVSSSMTINAIAVATGFNNSAVASAAYTIQTAAATPTFSPAAGTYTSAQNVTLSDTTPGATIYYTTNGSTPTTSSTKYAAAIPVSSSMTINAIAIATGYNNSAVGTATYTIQSAAATPTFSPAAGTYASAQNVTLSDTTSGATIYYTTNGSTPSTSSTKYTSAIPVTSTTTINAIAAAKGLNNSAVATAIYTIQPVAATPTFSPAAGTYTSTQNVTLSDTTSGATIYYTTNGSTPNTSSTKYTAAIPVASTITINAIAVATGYSNSAVGSATYTINNGSTPLISFGSGFTTSTGLQFNGGSALSGTHLRVTDGNANESRSAYWTTPVSVQGFTTTFSFQQTPGTNPTADGFTFVLQNSALTALGSSGGGLGYGPDPTGASTSIPNSIAIKFDLYNNAGEGSNSTGLYMNGAVPTLPAIDLTSSGVNLHAGDVMNAQIAYNGATLSLTITDTVTAATFSTSWAVNIPSTIGSNTAYAGFTGGTGGSTAIQDIITWTYSTAPFKTPVTYWTPNLTAVSSGPTFRVFAWSGFPEGSGTTLDSAAVGDSVTFTVNVAQAGVYDIQYSTKTNPNRATVQLAVNGTNVGPVTDQYGAAPTLGTFDLGTFNFATAGNYSLKFTVAGKDAASSGYTLAFDDIILAPQ